MIHPHGYWLEVSGSNTHVCDKKLADALCVFKGDIVDIGCGDGSYVRNFLDHGINCIGYDGSPLTPELSSGLCTVKDFSQPVNIGKFDVVISLEVGEHIPGEYEQIFIDNLCNTSRGIICLSWGVVGQPGWGHVNCRDNDYIINEFIKRGFRHLKAMSNKLRSASELPWFKNTIMVFNDTRRKRFK